MNSGLAACIEAKHEQERYNSYREYQSQPRNKKSYSYGESSTTPTPKWLEYTIIFIVFGSLLIFWMGVFGILDLVKSKVLLVQHLNKYSPFSFEGLPSL